MEREPISKGYTSFTVFHHRHCTDYPVSPPWIGSLVHDGLSTAGIVSRALLTPRSGKHRKIIDYLLPTAPEFPLKSAKKLNAHSARLKPSTSVRICAIDFGKVERSPTFKNK